MLVAVEPTKQGVTMREDTGSGLMFADQPVGESGRPQKFAESIREGARVETRKRRVTTNVKSAR